MTILASLQKLCNFSASRLLSVFERILDAGSTGQLDYKFVTRLESPPASPELSRSSITNISNTQAASLPGVVFMELVLTIYINKQLLK